MRINIYAEELTDRFEVVRRTPSTGHTDQQFYGLRFYLRSPPELHADAEDDDTSAVTVWFATESAMEAFADGLRMAAWGREP